MNRLMLFGGSFVMVLCEGIDLDRGVFRTLKNILHGAFHEWLTGVNYLPKKSHLRYLSGF